MDLAVAVDDVVDRAGDEEVLLPQAELAPLLEVVVGVEDLGDDLGGVLGLHGAHVVAAVEEREVELLAGARGPEAEGVDGVGVVTGDGRVVGHAEDRLFLVPDDAEAALAVALVLGVAAELDGDGVLGARDLPGVAEAEPLVGALDLGAVADDLLEDAELVADPVAVAGQAQRRHRLEEARREAPEAAVAEAGVGLLLDQVVEVDVELGEHGAVLLEDVERLEVGGERAAEEELGREVVGPLDVLLVVGALRLRPALHEPVAHREGQRHVAIEGRGGGEVARARVLDVIGEGAAEHHRVHPGAVVFDFDSDGRSGIGRGCRAHHRRAYRAAQPSWPPIFPSTADP